MTITERVEKVLGRMVKCSRGHDANLFIKGPAFADFPNPTLKLQTRDCGQTGSFLEREYVKREVKQYILLCEDADSPLHKTPSLHGLFYAIPGWVGEFNGADVDVQYVIENGNLTISFGQPAKTGIYRKGSVFIRPRPLFGHGIHRYFWELVALNQEVDEKMLYDLPSRDQLAKEIVGKVLGWGDWVGRYETKLEDFIELRERKDS